MKLVAAFWLCLAAWFTPWSGAGAADPVRIAFIGGLSGPFALQGEETLRNFEVAVDLLNRRGGALGGRKFEIVPFDNKGNPQETLVVLRQAIDQGLRHVISGVSPIALAISDAVAKHNARDPDRSVLFLDYGALDPSLTESKCSFWHFRFEAHATTQTDVLTDFMAKQSSLRKVYLVNQDYSFGQSVSRMARERLGAKRPDVRIVGDDLVPLGKVKDFAPYFAKIRAAEADAVLTSNWGNDLALLIKAGHDAGTRATFYTLLASFYGTAGAMGAGGGDRVRSLAAWHINAADPARQKSLLEYKGKMAAVSNLAYLPVFRVIDMLGAAFDQAGTTDPARVAYALEGAHYAGPSGDSWMRAEDHQMIAPVYLMSFAKAGRPGVEVEEEKSGFGWKTEALVAARDAVPPLKCQMERPPR
ncbi:MAG: branched-chain amino acid ABC transporter substrate-binding protein [Burkholderiales bacterium]